MEELRRRRGHEANSPLLRPLNEGIAAAISSCRDDVDPMGFIRREQHLMYAFSHGCKDSTFHSCNTCACANMQAAEAIKARPSVSTQGAGYSSGEAAELMTGYSSARWPHQPLLDHHHHHPPCAACTRSTCPACCSSACSSQLTIASSGSTRWDAHDSVKGAFESGIWCSVQNQRPNLRSQSCWAAIKPARNFRSHYNSNFSTPVNCGRTASSSSSCCCCCQNRGLCRKEQSSRRRRRSRRRGGGGGAAAGTLPVPPFPAPHGVPYVLCQHCSLLLFVLPAAHPLSNSTPLVTLKCGFCLKLSTFSTRHLSLASSTPPVPSLPPPAPTESADASPMPGYGASPRDTDDALDSHRRLSGLPELALQSKSSHLLEGDGGHTQVRQNSEHWPGVCSNHIIPCGAGEPVTENDLSVDSSRVQGDLEAHASSNGDQLHIIQAKDFDKGDSCNGIHEKALQEITMAAQDCSNAESSQSHAKEIRNFGNVGCELTASQDEQLQRGLPSDSSWDDEITVMSSVQHWVDSLTPEIGYESDSSLHCSEKCAVDCEKHTASHRRSPLHQHFGYKSPSELFEKIVFSEDEEMKARTETSSTASSSSSSTSNTCQHTDIGATCMPANAPSFQGSCDNSPNNKRDIQSSLSKLLKRGLKQRDQSPGTLKTRDVVVNGHVLSSAAVKRSEERAGKLRPGSYWYDCKAGFWGVEGGPCLGVLPPFIEELSLHPMAGNCSNGSTQVYVNGRELHIKDLAVLSQRGLSDKAGKAYTLGFDGVLVDETTGLEIRHLGKLAPTVERKGKGFGMFAGTIFQEKAAAAQENPANSSH